MNIHVTQGHEKSISLEIFFRAALCLTKAQRERIYLHAFQDSILDTFKVCGFSDEEKNRLYLHLNIVEPVCKEKTETMSSLLSAFESIENDDVLVTMPSSKDQFYLNGSSYSGHTEFFRAFFSLQWLPMFFRSERGNILLLTDHMPLRQVSQSIAEKEPSLKVDCAIQSYRRYFGELNQIFFSGINPHCGENGRLGKEDIIISQIIKTLSKSYPDLDLQGPVPGDVIYKERKKNNFIVFANHDQGLAPFKFDSGFLGVNVTGGLPFLRLSVDHGTAFELYGKNKADINGALYTLMMALGVVFEKHR